MTARSWLQPHLTAVLKDRRPVLAKWREQLPGLQGHVRNFENWVLVELVHRLLGTGFAECVLTNGFFAEGEDALSVKRVRHYQGTVATRAEVGWVVVLPNDPVRCTSAKKSFDRISQRLHQETDVYVNTTPIVRWLLSTVIVPMSDRPPNRRLRPTAAGATMSRRG